MIPLLAWSRPDEEEVIIVDRDDENFVCLVPTDIEGKRRRLAFRSLHARDLTPMRPASDEDWHRVRVGW